MACHNGHGARQVLTALRAVDDTITEKDSTFWHKTLGTHKGGRGTAPVDEAIDAIDAAWLAATKNNSHWSTMTPQERLDSQNQFRSLRGKVESGELALTDNQVLKLEAYATKRKATPTVVKVGSVAAGLLASIGIMAGPAAAAENPVPATPANASVLHMPVGKNGNCAEDFTLAKAGRTHKVTWQKPNGKIVNKKMAKGSTACIYTGPDGKTETATVNDGVITQLPRNFPTQPTASDIASLGLTKDRAVAPNLRIGAPTGTPITAPQLADTVRPVGIVGQSTEKIESGAGYINKEVIWTQWDITGGQGALATSTKNPNGDGFITTYTKLDPNGTVRVTVPLVKQTRPDSDGRMTYNFQGTVVPDYGQTNLPSTLTQNWDLDGQRAMDSSGRGYTAGKYANTANPWWLQQDGHPNDGWFDTSSDGLTIINQPRW